MIAFVLILSMVLPPAVWLLGYFNLDPGEGTMEEACARFEYALVRSSNFWMWVIYVVVMTLIFSGTATKIIRSINP